MQFLKISCTTCSHYKACPQKTRMYVNYCGSNFKRMAQQINDATFDCRARRDHLITQNVFSSVSAQMNVAEVLNG